MLAAPARAWSVFKQIFADHWEAFAPAHARYQTASSNGLVATMLAWGNPEQIGDIASRCLPCGPGQHRVAMSCQASLCLRWAKVYVDNWVSQVSRVLHAGVIDRHIILTVPAMFRTIFDQNAAVTLRVLIRCGVQCLDDFSSSVRGKAHPGGSMTVLHTHGRHGQSHPHRHVLATRGGYEAHRARWEHLPYLPSALLRRQWQWHLLTMLRQTLKTEAIQQWVDPCCRPSPDGLVTNVHKGAVPAQAHSVARYVAQYGVSPPIAVRRIAHADGARVTYHYGSHRTERMAPDTVDAATFMGRMVQHGRPKGCKRIRSYGVQATKTFAKVQAVMQAALAQVEAVVKGAGKISARLTYRQRYEQGTGRDPFRCSHCGEAMAVWRIWHPKYGVMYDEGEVMKRGTSASTAQRAGP